MAESSDLTRGWGTKEVARVQEIRAPTETRRTLKCKQLLEAPRGTESLECVSEYQMLVTYCCDFLKYFKNFYFLIMCVYLSIALCTCVQFPKRSEEGDGSPGAGVTGVVSCLMWVLEPNSCPLEAQCYDFNAEPSLQPLAILNKY